ncbi:hypothetical protein B0H67DRAFT_495956 [Lasiosphaeris hirsuta]|uniref:Survival protein SurE-like phosphatase/nucleotidase domain-containing protein n=1 Tax=Lasiosphaeris hirsuta TaxID=260670 RepID=A0AA40DNA6_9PEZI|nr:hypothetical protein B0H67DRAFT_495956 [Lasiosphaeris hirsuta]
MHILIVNDDGPPSPHSSPYVHSLVRELQQAGHVVSVCLPHTQRSWIGKAHMIGQTVKPTYYRPPPPSAPAAGLTTDTTSTQANTGDDDSNHGTTHTRPSTRPGTEEWVLVDGTPASCVQIGLYHFFADRGPVDLVVSGPNYGRNTTAVFALSSGTLGGALEAAVCRRRAVALSYAFFSRNHDTAIIAAASKQSVKVIEALWRQWPTDGSVDLYSVNVPLLEGLEDGKVLFTGVLQNYWGPGSCFTEVDGSVEGEEEEEWIREGEGRAEELSGQGEKTPACHTHKHFKWSPRFTDVYKSVEDAPPGNDGWAVKEGHTSITPLKANFWQASTELQGKELQLEGPSAALPETVKGATTPTIQSTLAIREGRIDEASSSPSPHLYALVDYEDPYVQPLLISSMDSLFPAGSWTLLKPPPASNDGLSLASLLPPSLDLANAKVLQISPYESIDFDFAAQHPTTCLINSYMIRKALIRKHFLSATVEGWVAKQPQSVLGTHVKRSEAFEVDFAEFLEDALVEAWDLRASLECNAEILAGSSGNESVGRGGGAVEWWILKPSMSDRGQGIRLFSTMGELQAIFDAWEPESESDEEGSDDDEQGGEASTADDDGPSNGDGDTKEIMDDSDNIMTSHLRHFVAQPYIQQPLLLPELDNRKFHVRVYVLAVGSLQVYVYKDMLALFAAKPYQPPQSAAVSAEEGGIDLDAHLTNTCLQGDDGAAKANSVHRFWDLPLSGNGSSHVTADSICDQICAVTGELFEAAARGMMIHFQPLDHAFEVYGLDFLVDAAGTAWLLEANAFPDFKQTGDLSGVVAGFWRCVLRLAAVPFASAGSESSKGGKLGQVAEGEENQGKGEVAAATASAGVDQMVLVRDIDLGRRWGATP